jgi:hypothetical protein
MTLTLKQRLALPVPKLMRTLSRDPRGYPIPWIVLIDANKLAQFTINDVRRTEEARRKRLCAICGKRMGIGQSWFIGGSRCFLHPRGGFLDGPTHYYCGAYALQVCPFLAARSYARRIDDAKLGEGAIPDGMELRREDFMMPRLPERFGFGRSDSWHWQRTGDRQELGIFIVNTWSYIEWWRNGEECPPPDSGIAPSDQEMAA